MDATHDGRNDIKLFFPESRNQIVLAAFAINIQDVNGSSKVGFGESGGVESAQSHNEFDIVLLVLAARSPDASTGS
jgi:hypothetical protein